MGQQRSKPNRRSGGSYGLLVLFGVLLAAGIGAALFLALGADLAADGADDADGGTTTTDGVAAPDAGNAPAGAVAPRPHKAGPVAATSDGIATLRGVVKFWKTKEPAPGLELTLRQGEAPPVTATTGADGTFSIAGVPAGGGYELRGARAGFAPIELTSIDLAPGQSADVGTLWLAVPVDLAVLVLDWTGSPIADAEVAAFAVSASRAGSDDAWSDEARERRTLSLIATPKATKTARTGADGRAVVGGLMPGTYRAEARADGRASASRFPIVLAPEAPTVPVRLILGPGHPLGGTVTDEKGAPVAGARVIVARGQEWVPGLDKWFADTAADGKYRVEGLPAGPVTVYLLRSGMPLLLVGYAGIPDTDRFDVRLRPGGTIRGVITGEDGKPVAGAEVVAAMQNNWSPVSAKSGADGTYELKDLPAGPLAYFRIAAAGFVPYPDPGANNQQGAGESLREGAVMQRDVVLRRGLTVKVLVRGPDAKAVEGAEVLLFMARAWAGEVRPWRGVTDADGRTELTGVLPGVYLAVLRASGFVQPGMPANAWEVISSPEAMPDAWRVTLVPGETVSKEFTLSRGAAVSGRVLDAEGRPVAGATVTVDVGRSGDPVHSDAQGDFRIDAVPPMHRVSVIAEAAGHLPGVSEPFAVDEGAPAENIEVRLGAGGTVSGTVRTRDGKPFTGAMVRWVPWKIDPNDVWSSQQFGDRERHPVSADGRFTIEGIPEGDVTVRADAEGYLPASDANVRVTAKQETGGVDLILAPPREIRGRVDAQQGGVVAGATISAQFTGTAQNRRWGFVTGLSGNPTAQSATDGTFVLKGLEEGNYNLWAQAPGFAAGSMVQTSTGAGDVLLSLAKGLSISGFVKDQDGKPFAGVPVQAQRIDRQGGQRNWYTWGGSGLVYTAPDGTFEIQDLAEGNYNLQVSGAWQWEREVNVEDTLVQGVPAGRREVEIVVRTGAVLEGRVLDGEDRPVGVGWISAQFEAGNGGHDWSSQRWGQLRPDGTFRLAGLKPGQYSVWFYGAFQPKQEKGVSAGTLDLTVHVEPGFAIAGQVFDEKGLSVGGGFNVQTRKAGTENWGWRNTVQPGDGRFIVSALDAGAWDLQVGVDGYAPIVVPNVTVGTTDLRVSLKKGLEITGFAVDASGNPVAGASVQVQQTEVPSGTAPSQGGAETDAQGRFRVIGLASGQFTVAVRANGSAPAIARGVQAGAMDLKFVLTAGVSISGSIVDASGNPVSNCQINVMTDDGQWLSGARPDAEGKFEVRNVPEGQRCRISGYMWAGGSHTSFTHEPVVEAGATDVKIEVK